MAESTPVRPLLKWVGGKTQIIDEVMARFPKEMNNYHEPFVGGGSVLLALLTLRQSSAIRITGLVYASDLNANLINLYTAVQVDPEGLIGETRKLIAEYAACTEGVVNRVPKTLEEAMCSHEAYYYWTRAQFNALSKEDRASAKASAMLLFLNKTCFRGVYREGPRGFNVPYGNYTNPQILDESNLRAISTLFAGVVFTHIPFQTALTKVVSGDFVYLDPPYAPETDNSFVSYTADGFGLENHTTLFAACAAFKEKRIGMLMSNADVPLVREAFPESAYTTAVISCRRAIHSKKPDARTNEVLITN